MDKRRVLLTGANGLVGQKLVRLLRNRPAVELLATGRGENRIQDTSGYTWQTLDLANSRETQALLRDFEPTEIINSAAMTQVDACEQEPETCRAVNTDALRPLVEYCQAQQQRLLHISTDFVFDGEGGPYQESDTPNPLSVYGQSKLDAERLIQDADIPAAILRTVLVYGYMEGLGRSNIVLWVRKSLSEGQEIRVVDDQYRSPTLAEDLADGIAQVLFRNKTGVYHLSGPEIMSVLEIAQRVARYWKLDENLITPISSSELNQPAKRPPKTGFVLLKAQTELDYTPHTLEGGLGLMERQFAG